MSRYAPGAQVSHFRLDERLGAGGAGEVFRATDLQLGRDVAVKFLAPEFVQLLGRLGWKDPS